jgi:hypothetical protein
VVDAAPFQCLMLGLPKAGKTTFLASLWHVLKSGEIPGSLLMGQREGDQEYLNLIADQWSKCLELDRTPRSGHMGVTILLRDPDWGKVVRMSIPDVSGEIYASQWEDRECDPEFADLVASAGGCLAFVHPGTLTRTAWIADATGVYDGWVGEDSEPDEAGSKEAGPEGAEAEGEPSATPWSAKKAPTQVQMVEVLQFLAELAGRRMRLALVVSAWDLVTDGLTPDQWVKRDLPLLWQFLRTNPDLFEVVYMGVSAQGGTTEDAATLLEHAIASHRIRVVASGIESSDITHPIRWLMSPAASG